MARKKQVQNEVLPVAWRGRRSFAGAQDDMEWLWHFPITGKGTECPQDDVLKKRHCVPFGMT